MSKIEIGKYLSQIEKWEYISNILGGKIEIKTDFNQIGLTPFNPNDPEWYFFNICPYREIFNITQNKRIFYGLMSSTFKIKLGNQMPPPDLLFFLMDEAMKDFARYYHENTKDTLIHIHKFERIRFEDHEKAIIQAINIWQTGIKNISDN